MANRARIGGFLGGLISAGVAIAFFRTNAVLVTAVVAAFVIAGAIIGAVIPYRP